MRKVVLWCSAGVVAAVTIGALAAAYACRHPQSPFSRFVFGCYEVDAQYNPFHKMSESAVRQVASAARKTADGITGAAAAGANAGACICVPPEEPRPVVGGMVADSGEQDAVRPECRMTGKIVIEEEAQRAVVVLPGAVEESEEPAQVLPPAVEEPTRAPLPMPSADEIVPEKTATRGFFDRVMDYFTSCPKPQASVGGAEESESKCPATPPDCKQDPSYPEQYSGCPGLSGCPCHKATPKSFFPWSTFEKKNMIPPASEHPSQAIEKDLTPSFESKPIDEPNPQDVDTTDFRPSDARRYGLGRPMPF